MRFLTGIPLIVNRVKVRGPDDVINVDLMLDTGAAYTTLSSSVLRLVGYDPTKVQERLEVITANGIISAQKLKVDAIVVGDCCSQNVEVLCHDMPQLVEMHGLLGLSFLKFFRTVIDFKEGYLEIS